MTAKFFVYVIVTILVIWSMEALNINGMFKKNQIVKARVFYILLGFAMIYLVTNFIIDLFTSYNFI